MYDDIRIPLNDAQREVAAGSALLVCAYDDPAKCSSLGGQAISLADLQARENSLPKDQQILFICA